MPTGMTGPSTGLPMHSSGNKKSCQITNLKNAGSPGKVVPIVIDSFQQSCSKVRALLKSVRTRLLLKETSVCGTWREIPSLFLIMNIGSSWITVDKRLFSLISIVQRLAGTWLVTIRTGNGGMESFEQPRDAHHRSFRLGLMDHVPDRKCPRTF